MSEKFPDEFALKVAELAEEAKQYDTCMSLYVNEDGRCVELILDSGLDTGFSEWIPGEGADIGLIRDRDTKQVIGVRLSLLNDRLLVWHKGPLRVNAGFRKSDAP